MKRKEIKDECKADVAVMHLKDMYNKAKEDSANLFTVFGVFQMKGHK